MWQRIKALFERKRVFKEARIHCGEFVTVEYLGYHSKALNLHTVQYQGTVYIIHGGQIREQS